MRAQTAAERATQLEEGVRTALQMAKAARTAKAQVDVEVVAALARARDAEAMATREIAAARASASREVAAAKEAATREVTAAKEAALQDIAASSKAVAQHVNVACQRGQSTRHLPPATPPSYGPCRWPWMEDYIDPIRQLYAKQMEALDKLASMDPALVSIFRYVGHIQIRQPACIAGRSVLLVS